MPSEAKFSPAFQEVSPETVPPHSFCQIRLPMRRVSAGVRLIAPKALLATAKASATTVQRVSSLRLDVRAFFSSVRFRAAPLSKSLTGPGVTPMKRLIICLGAVFIASIGLAQDKPQLKD